MCLVVKYIQVDYWDCVSCCFYTWLLNVVTVNQPIYVRHVVNIIKNFSIDHFSQKTFQENPESHNGAIRDGYRWAQTLTDCDLRIQVGKHYILSRLLCRVDLPRVGSENNTANTTYRIEVVLSFINCFVVVTTFI